MTEQAPWWRGATLYQVYPRSFFDTNGDGIGDLRGVTEKLPYIADLGVDGLWLSPFFRSPMKDFGYDVSDYRDVDPIFGTLADFDALLARAHALGLKVLIDQVWSHSSDQHAWFKQSAADRNGPYADYYVWADAKPDGSPPNNWQAQFGGPSWTWHPRRRQYYLHNFLSSQPDLNFWNPALRQEILDIARFWLDRGVDGFRLDVINFLYHDHALSDNPPATLKRAPPMASLYQHHRFDRSRPETLAFVQSIRTVLDSYPARMSVGEIFDENQLDVQRAYTEGDDRLHTAYSFYLLDAQALTPELFSHALSSWQDCSGWPSWSLGNHDVPRFPTRLGLRDDPARIKLALACLMALRGTIFLYQGDELGLPQADVPFERLRDPFAIAAFTGQSFRDGARTPFPWHGDLVNAGFSEAEELWLPIDPRHTERCASSQSHDPHSVRAMTKQLIALRNQHPVLRTGDALVLLDSDQLFAVLRFNDTDRVLCLFNLSEEPKSFASEKMRDVVLSEGSVDQGRGAVSLGPWAFAFVRVRPE